MPCKPVGWLQKGNDGIIIRTGDRLSDYEVWTSQDINGKREIYWKLESSAWKLDGLNADGDWIGKPFSGISVSGDTRFSDCKRGKNKDCFANKQYFFSKFPKILLDKGFKLPYRCFKGLFFFSVEPPFGRCFFHQGVDIPHPYQVPDTF